LGNVETTLTNGLGTVYGGSGSIDDATRLKMCSKGFVKFSDRKVIKTKFPSLFTMYNQLHKAPVGISMLIPGCNDGVVDLTRGGTGGVCDRTGGCKLKMNLFRSCSNSNLL
jgi:hypothetical protein